MDRMIQSYPKGMLPAFGITSMSTPEGFLAGQVFNLAPMALVFSPSWPCAGAIASSEERGTIDVVLGNPIPRWQLVWRTSRRRLSPCSAARGQRWIMWETTVLVGVDLSLAVSAEAVLNLFCPTCAYFGG
jgi:ABC-2 type transport system permease protein